MRQINTNVRKYWLDARATTKDGTCGEVTGVRYSLADAIHDFIRLQAYWTSTEREAVLETITLVSICEYCNGYGVRPSRKTTKCPVCKGTNPCDETIIWPHPQATKRGRLDTNN